MIKFKEITTDGKWVEEKSLIQGTIEGREFTQLECSDFDDYRQYEVIPETVCVFTGLHDKNGKEIYQGDILKSAYFQNAIVEMWRFGWHVKTETGSHHSFVTANHTFEITGNTHDHLLVQKTENDKKFL